MMRKIFLYKQSIHRTLKNVLENIGSSSEAEERREREIEHLNKHGNSIGGKGDYADQRGFGWRDVEQRFRISRE